MSDGTGYVVAGYLIAVATLVGYAVLLVARARAATGGTATTHRDTVRPDHRGDERRQRAPHTPIPDPEEASHV